MTTPDSGSDEIEPEKPQTLPTPAIPASSKRYRWKQVAVFAGLPALALILCLTASVLRWNDGFYRQSEQAQVESILVAREAATALLSYEPDTVEQNLVSAQALLTEDFHAAYTQAMTEVIIPRAQQKRITNHADVAAAASVSADPRHAVALVFVNQTVRIGSQEPAHIVSSVRVTLDKIDDQWLISGFDPI